MFKIKTNFENNKKNNLDFKVIEDLKEELSMSKIKKIVDGLECAYSDIIRKNEKDIKGIKIDLANQKSVINLISMYKIFMQRPISDNYERYFICRPPEKILIYIKA